MLCRRPQPLRVYCSIGIAQTLKISDLVALKLYLLILPDQKLQPYYTALQ